MLQPKPQRDTANEMLDRLFNNRVATAEDIRKLPRIEKKPPPQGLKPPVKEKEKEREKETRVKEKDRDHREKERKREKEKEHRVRLNITTYFIVLIVY